MGWKPGDFFLARPDGDDLKIDDFGLDSRASVAPERRPSKNYQNRG